jgi:phage tail sheath protein FI
MRTRLNVLPPSAAMAGVYSLVDNAVGVHKAPANVSLGGVVSPVVNITSDNQEDLNLPLNGKAVNAIRSFIGKGTLVWGARTLDGNSQDWRYISVRRAIVMIEQSVKTAMEAYVFEPNDSSTWLKAKTSIDNFLTTLWKGGTLVGASPTEAFETNVGLGVTMTPNDILDGIMRISVKVAISRPAEFIVITFQQKMQES